MATDLWTGCYVIRHRATGEYMPLYRRGKGYSHWNPSKPKHIAAELCGVPRILKSRKQAILVARLWASQPNLEVGRDHDNYDYDLKITDDDRKLEDIEIVPVDLHFGSSEMLRERKK